VVAGVDTDRNYVLGDGPTDFGHSKTLVVGATLVSDSGCSLPASLCKSAFKYLARFLWNDRLATTRNAVETSTVDD